ncbi:hypothetical protein DICA3_C04830 [Diutina catenulata]
MFGFEARGKVIPWSVITIKTDKERSVDNPQLYLEELLCQLKTLGPGFTLGMSRPWSLCDEYTSAQCARLVDVVGECRGTLARGTITTYRDIYYKDAVLYQTQAKATAVVNHFAKRVGLTPTDLGVVASQKGLIAGEGSLRVSSTSETQHFTYNEEPALIPRDVCALSASAIVILEKDAVFTQLMAYIRVNGFPVDNVIFVTGKGFPDQLTRNVSSVASDLPQRVFVDSDVYGVHIARCFPDATYGGVSILNCLLGMVDVTARERKMAANLIDDIDCRAMSKELQRGWVFNKKAEINVATPRAGTLGDPRTADVIAYLYSEILSWAQSFSTVVAAWPVLATPGSEVATTESSPGQKRHKNAQ